MVSTRQSLGPEVRCGVHVNVQDVTDESRVWDSFGNLTSRKGRVEVAEQDPFHTPFVKHAVVGGQDKALGSGVLLLNNGTAKKRLARFEARNLVRGKIAVQIATHVPYQGLVNHCL